MSSISNRFFVTALDDGTTLHGNLSADGSLSQAWNGSGAIPDWSSQHTENQPTIFLTLLSGSDLVQPSMTDYEWYYNGGGQGQPNAKISFDQSGTSTSPQAVAGKFFKTTKTVSFNGVSKEMPALKIIDNLASSNNEDIDLITFKGNYLIGTTSISFAATAQIRISTITSGSSLGVINFVNGVSDITSEGQTITAYGVLYGSDGTPDSSVTTLWFLNDSGTGTPGDSIGGVPNAYQINEGDVTDHAMLRCEFKKNNETIYTAYAAIDDMQDPEFMYIQYNGANGNAASLRKGGNPARFDIWVGTRTSQTVKTEYNIFKVKLLDGSGNTITDARLDGTGDLVNGFRVINNRQDNKAYLNIPYDFVKDNAQSNLTGILLAETTL